MREKEPSSFITNMSYAVWGPEVLANHCVRSQSNVVESELTSTKKFTILKEFEKWMRMKRKMPQMLIDEQLDRSKVNKYFNGAITAARKKTNYKIKEKVNKNKTVKNTEKRMTRMKANNEHKMSSTVKKRKETERRDETSNEMSDETNEDNSMFNSDKGESND